MDAATDYYGAWCAVYAARRSTIWKPAAAAAAAAACSTAQPLQQSNRNVKYQLPHLARSADMTLAVMSHDCHDESVFIHVRVATAEQEI